MKKKILALCLVVVLAITAVTGATLAYFTDTAEVNNTFTMGKVKIELDEAPVNADGKKVDGNRVIKNDYTATNMVPGHVFDKDPTIHVKAGSEECYIFLDVTINKFNSLAWVVAANEGKGTVAKEFFQNDKFSSTNYVTYLATNKDARIAAIDKWISGINHADWTIANVSVDGDYVTFRLAYNKTVNAKTATEDINIKFMDSFQMPATVTQEMIENGTKVGHMAHNFNTGDANFKMDFVASAIQADEMENITAAYKAMFGNTAPMFTLPNF